MGIVRLGEREGKAREGELGKKRNTFFRFFGLVIYWLRWVEVLDIYGLSLGECNVYSIVCWDFIR